MNIPNSPKAEHKPVKRRHPISKHGRHGRGKSEPEVKRNPGQLYNRRKWRCDERQKDVTRESRDCQEKEALSGWKYGNTTDIITTEKSGGNEEKDDASDSVPITNRHIHASGESLNEPVNEPFNETTDVRSDVTGIQADMSPSSEQLDKEKKRRKKKRRRKKSPDHRRSILRHHKHPFIIDDDAPMVSDNDDDDNFEGDDEKESSPEDLQKKKRRAGKRKKTHRSSTRRGLGPSSSDDDGNILGPLPPLEPPRHQPLTKQPLAAQQQTQHQKKEQLQTEQPPVKEKQTNPQVQANTRLRNIPQEYRKRAAALRTRSPTDYMLNGFSQASMRVFEFATGGCANAECTYNSSALTGSCNRNAPCVTSQLPPLIARGIVSGGCDQPTSQLVDDDSERLQDFSVVSGRSRNRNFHLF